MFGHDMSWASFHVLEVMSCQKYQQKRVGYLAAVQSFRPDTEVLMLATNLLKKFATLTPLEPRLIKKLLPPLTNLIRTTPAMSLLYECINGLIQGGILEGGDGAREGAEIASLCVGKLRGMIIVEGDPNPLLAFNKIVASHPQLVSMHQDVIMGCIDDPDISIRLQALQLGAGMVNSDNLVAVVERLMQQLRSVPTSNNTADDGRAYANGVEPAADFEGEDPEETLRPTADHQGDSPALPLEYRTSVIHQILEICSHDTYSNIIDFEWYIHTLVKTVKLVPVGQSHSDSHKSTASIISRESDTASAIGWELRNVAVRGPLLLVRAIPQLFTGFDLNPVAPTAQRKVSLRNELNLDTNINEDLAGLLQRADLDFVVDSEAAEFESFYNERPLYQTQKVGNAAAIEMVPSVVALSSSYQQSGNSLLDTDALMRKRIERRERNKDDPFYIGNDNNSSGTLTPFHDILRNANGEELDVDSIPIMDLEIGTQGTIPNSSDTNSRKPKRKRPRNVHIAKDENIGNEDLGVDRSQESLNADDIFPNQKIREKAKKSLLQVDSSGLSTFSLDSTDSVTGKLEGQTQEAQDTEMAKALAEVERLRLEMQRASERIQATDGAPTDGTLVKKKRRKKPIQSIGETALVDEHDDKGGAPNAVEDNGIVPVIKKKKKKKKKKTKPVAAKPNDEE
ncbi:AP-3 complex subunit delta, partial [Lecanoromycetidae sp. Uapishka_2]